MASSLTIQGVDFTRAVPADTVTISETAGDSNPTLSFTIEYRLGASLTWMGRLSHDVVLQDLTNARTLFKGNLVNAVRRHGPGNFALIDCTVLGYNAWLDRLYLPKWTSKRANGTRITSDRDMVTTMASALASAGGGFAFAVSNTYINETSTTMPLIAMNSGGTPRDILQAIADAASTDADPTVRRFYVGQDYYLHYFKGNEHLSAPYLLGDASYTRTVLATSGLISLWALREASGATAYDAKSYANITLNGSYTQNVTGLTANEPMMTAVTFDGSSGYASATGANLHNADGPWSVELWFKRSRSGTQEALWSGGTGDILIGLDATDHIRVQKEGTGDHFISNATVTDTLAHHLVVTRTGGAVTTVYLDGNSKAGTTTSRTFVTAGNPVNIGRKLSTTDQFFKGTLNHVAFYNAALASGTVTTNYNNGMTIVPDEFEFETDVNQSGTRVYVKGSTASGTGWVYVPANSNYNQSFSLDAPQSSSATALQAVGKGFLRGSASVLFGGRASVTGFDGWRAGQTVTINDVGLGIDGSDSAVATTYEIKQLDTTVNLGSGVNTYDIAFGTLPWSGSFDLQRKKRQGNSVGGAQSAS